MSQLIKNTYKQLKAFSKLNFINGNILINFIIRKKNHKIPEIFMNG